MPLPVEPPPADLANRDQWVAWKSELRMGKQTKIPYDPRTFQRASSTDQKTWGTLEKATAAADRFDGIGFCFSAGDPFAGVDLDACIDDQGVMELWAAKIVALLDSYTEVSPSGRGVKIFLKGSLPENSRKRTGRVEMYDRGRYFTFTGRRWADAPATVNDRADQLLEVYRIVFESDHPAPATAPTVDAVSRRPVRIDDAELIDRARSADNGHDFDLLWRGDVSGHGDDHSAADQALCNHLAFWCGPDRSRIDGLFRQSGLNRDKWTKRADYRDSTISLALKGRTEFYDPPAEHGPCEPDVVASIGRLLAGKGVEDVPAEDPQVEGELAKYFPSDLREPPGVVGEICRWINDTAYKPQPVLAVANALSFFGAVVGRKVRTPTDLRTNLYCLGVGESGCGKDHSRKCVKRICDAAGLTASLLGGEEVSSDSAIFNAVHARPSILFQFDEIGHFLANANSKYAATHQKNIAPTFTKLFSSANTTLIGKEYAGKDNPRKDVVQPNVCLYGTTVPGRLYEGMSLSEIADGFLGRMMVFQSDDADPIERDVAVTDPPEELVTVIQQWFSRTDLPKAEGNLAALTQHLPIIVPFDADATAEISRFRDRCREYKRTHRNDNGLDILWTRAVEHARKVALVVACGCEFDSPVVKGDVAAWAVKLVEHLVTSLVAAVRDSVAGSEYERDLLHVLRAIRAAGPLGITKSQLIHRTRRLTPKTRQDILNQLISTEQAFSSEKKGARGFAAVVYVSKKVVL